MRCLGLAGCDCSQTGHVLCGSPFLCIRSHDILANVYTYTVRIHMCACVGACAVSACLSIKAVDFIDSFRNCAITYVYFTLFLLLAKGYICKHSVLCFL